MDIGELYYYVAMIVASWVWIWLLLWLFSPPLLLAISLSLFLGWLTPGIVLLLIMKIFDKK